MQAALPAAGMRLYGDLQRMVSQKRRTFWAESGGTLALALPIVAGQLSQMFMGLLDSAMVGRLGVTPLAAAAFANNIVVVPFVWGIGLTTCVAVRVAQSHGAGDKRESGEVLRHGLVLAGASGLVMTAIVWLLSLHLDRFGQDPAVAREAREFLLLLGLSIVPGLLGFSFKQYCEAQGNAWAPTLIFLGAIPVNAALNWVFIYGNLGAPALGLPGAGVGTLVARTVALLALMLYVMRSPRFNGAQPPRWIAHLEPERLRSMLRIGVPASLQIVVEVGAFAAGAVFVGWLGRDPLAAHQITLSCASVSFMIPLGIAMAASMRIGQAVGAGELARVRPIGLNAFALSICFAACSAAIYAFFGSSVASLFVDDPEVVNIAAGLFVITAIFQLFDGVQVTGASVLRGLSDATVPMWVSIAAYWAFGLPIGYTLAFRFGMGAAGIWTGFALGLAISAVLLSWRFWSKSSPANLAASGLPRPAAEI